MKKNKEHKKGESTIGKIIYGFLLFMPLFAIGVTCGYAMFNKNAYRSYYGENINDTKYHNITLNNLEVGETYYFIANSGFDNIESRITIYTTNNKVVVNNQEHNIGSFVLYKEGTVPYYFEYDANGNAVNYINLNSSPLNVEFIFNYYRTVNDNQLSTILYKAVYEKESFVSEVFYYSVARVTESPLFSWATNSVIYTTMNATCTQLSITAPFIPLLLSYWLIISVIYFLYDIALMLIWLLHDKIHEMRDSLA